MKQHMTTQAEKSYGKILREENIPTQLLQAIQSLYQNSKTCVKYNDGQTSKPININTGVRQGYGLSPDQFRVTNERKETT
jgi:hypothetical protein